MFGSLLVLTDGVVLTGRGCLVRIIMPHFLNIWDQDVKKHTACSVQADYTVIALMHLDWESSSSQGEDRIQNLHV